MKYPCEKCGKTFASDFKRMKHLSQCDKQIIHSVAPPETGHKSWPKPLPRATRFAQQLKTDIVCQKCDTQFSSREGLELHEPSCDTLTLHGLVYKHKPNILSHSKTEPNFNYSRVLKEKCSIRNEKLETEK